MINSLHYHGIPAYSADRRRKGGPEMSDILALIGRIDNGDDWICWQKDVTLLSLPQTEDIGLSSEQYDRITLTHGSASSLNRSQYQAVIHRFNQATKHANKFAAWTDT